MNHAPPRRSRQPRQEGDVLTLQPVGWGNWDTLAYGITARWALSIDPELPELRTESFLGEEVVPKSLGTTLLDSRLWEEQILIYIS